jgi:hypothetical protein
MQASSLLLRFTFYVSGTFASSLLPSEGHQTQTLSSSILCVVKAIPQMLTNFRQLPVLIVGLIRAYPLCDTRRSAEHVKTPASRSLFVSLFEYKRT